MKMMQSKFSTLILCFICLTLLLSYSSNPPNGKTGAPGEGACNECHNGSSSLDGNISITGLPSTLIPNTTYNLTVTLDNPNGNAVRGGFQWVALDSGFSNAGSMSNASPMSAIMSSGGRMYHEHNGSNFFSGPLSWNVDWTAPSGPVGENITLYSRAVVGNGSGSSGDEVVSSTVSATIGSGTGPMTVAILDYEYPLCLGENTGVATAQVSGGSMPYTYLWSNGNTMNPANDLSSGLNTVTVTDSGGQTSSASVSLVDPSQVEVELVLIQNQICPGSNNGFIEVHGLGGTGGYTYQWSSGQTTNWIAGLVAGTYSVTVFDQNSCSASDSYSIQESGLNVTIQGASIFCSGTTIELSAPSGFTTYSWSTGDITPQTTVSQGGDVSLVVTDVSGCTGSSLVTLTELASPEPVIQGPTEICPGIPNTLIIPGTYTSYLWNNGDVGQSLVIDDCGTYFATVTDSNGCTGDTFTTVVCAQPFSVELVSLSPTTCYDANDGALEAGASIGTSNVSTLWSTGETSPFIDNLSEGEYSVTMTDNTGCSVIDTFIIPAFDTLVVLVDSLELPVCHDDTTSLIMVSGQGGAGLYSFFWPDGILGDSITQFGSGNYQVTIVDSNQCIDSNVVAIPSIDSLQIVIDSIDHVDCFGESSGYVQISGSGGHGGYEYFWADNTLGQERTMLMAGDYEVFVRDSLGCGVIDTIRINQNSEIQITANVINESQSGSNDGSISLNITGGQAPYTVLWPDGSTGLTLDNLSPGNYFVNVQDGLDCIRDTSYTILSGACNLFATASIENNSCPVGNSGSILVSVMGGIEPYTYTYSENIAPENIQNSTSIINLPAGSFSISITDQADCIFVLSVDIDEPESYGLELASNDVLCKGDSTGSFSILVDSLNANFPGIESIDFETYDGNNLVGLPAGSYMLTITDSNGCQLAYQGTIGEPEAELLVSNIIRTAASCDATEDGNIEVQVNGGTAPYSYLWSTGEEDINQIFVGAGNYSVTITDSNGCALIEDISIEANDTIPPTLELMSQTIYLDENGNAELPPLESFINMNLDQCGIDTVYMQDIQALDCSSGEVWIYVNSTDLSGNTSLDSTTLVVLDTLPPSITCPSVLSFGECEIVEYTISSTDNCDIVSSELINGFETGSQFPTGVTEVIYQFTDASNNAVECAFLIEVIPSIELDPIADITVCFGESSIVFLPEIEGLDIEILGAEADEPLEPGEYIMLATDTFGCMSVDTFQILENTEVLLELISAENESFENANNGMIAVETTGGSQPYSYEWTLDGEPFNQTSNLALDLAPGEYSIQSIDNNGCLSNLLTVTIEPGVSSNINETSQSKIDLYPNPTSDKLFLKKSADIKIISTRIVDTKGNTMLYENEFLQEYDLTTLTSGLYILIIESDRGILYKKILKSE